MDFKLVGSGGVLLGITFDIMAKLWAIEDGLSCLYAF